MNGILQLRRGGTKRKAPSKSFREKKKAQFKQRKKDELQKIVDSKSDDNTSGIAGISISGKNKAGKEVSDVIPANIPEKFHDFLLRNKGTQAAQSIIDNYASTSVNPYAAEIQRFKESPGGIEAFKERFPNPLVKAAKGIGNFFREGTVLGRILSSLNPSDKKKAEIITEESRRQPYDVDEGIMNYMDKIRRDQTLKRKGEGITYASPDMDIKLGYDPGLLDQATESKRRFVQQYTGKNVANLNQAEIENAYKAIMNRIQRDASGNTEELYQQAAYGDMSNFQAPSTEEQVVDEATGTQDIEQLFDLGSSNLSGATSETDYTAEMPDVSTYSIPDILDYNRPDQLRRQIDLNTQDLPLDTNSAFMGAPGFPAGGVESNMADGGYMGMSTFDKLKMIADGIADNR